MKKTINILSVIDLAAIAVWLTACILALIFAENTVISVIFLFAYILAFIAVAVFLVTSVILLILKKPFSKALLITAYAASAVWIIVFAAVINRFGAMISSLV